MFVWVEATVLGSEAIGSKKIGPTHQRHEKRETRYPMHVKDRSATHQPCEVSILCKNPLTCDRCWVSTKSLGELMRSRQGVDRESTESLGRVEVWPAPATTSKHAATSAKNRLSFRHEKRQTRYESNHGALAPIKMVPGKQQESTHLTSPGSEKT